MSTLCHRQGNHGKPSPKSGKAAAFRLALSLAILLTSSMVRAEPISIITSGGISGNDDSNSMTLRGAGFLLSGDGPFIAPFSTNCAIFMTCAPGTRINMSTTVTPSILADPATFNGVTYTGDSIYGGPFFDGSFSISAGTISVPAVAVDGGGSASTRFTFTGVLAAYDNFALSGTPLFTATLAGQGTATMHFSNRTELGGIFPSGLSYSFEESAPVPEPATMFLLGSGLAGVVVARRRRPR